MTVGAHPLAGGVHRWSADLVAECRVLAVRLTLLGDLLLVGIAAAGTDRDNRLHHVLRVADGATAWSEGWRADTGRVEGRSTPDR